MSDYVDIPFDGNDERFAATYDELPVWSAPFGLLLLRHIPLTPTMTVLDVGCGTGFPLIELAGRLGPNSRLYGIDSWQAAVDVVQRKIEARRLANVTIIAGDATKLPFEDTFFDLIVSNLGINNFVHPGAILSECRRALRSGGSIALTTNLAGHMREFYDAFTATLTEFNLKREKDALAEHVAQRATIESVTLQLQAAGFSVQAIVEESFELRYANASALMQDPFIRLAFLPAWKGVLRPLDVTRVLKQTEARLDAATSATGGLRLTIPMAFFQAEK